MLCRTILFILFMLQGDSGGPLQILVQQPFCMYRVVGVASFGIDCGRYPGVYTRVRNFVEWIEDIVWPEEPRRRQRKDWNFCGNQ